MSTDTASIATSTPKPSAASTKILRENFFNFSTINRENRTRFKRPSSVKKNFPSKENSRIKQRRSPTKEDYMEKRRQQAIEAMKIAEQRRLRLAQNEDSNQEDESLAESMANMSVVSVEYLPDGRLKLSQKELAARKEKHRRIKEHLAEQEARNRAKEARSRRRLTFRPKTSWTPRPVFKSNNFNHGEAAAKKSYKRVYTPTEIPASILKKPKTDFYRYSKDELRAMNPFGYYFM